MDTRSGDILAAGSRVDARVSDSWASTAVAVSVTLIGSQNAGVVEIDGGSGPVTALTVPGPSAMTTNLVIVPVDAAGALVITTTAGGHLVIDQVGHFDSATESSGGRFVQVDPIRAAHLVTGEDGREATVTPSELAGLPDGQVGAVLALITAEIGQEGGRVQVGPGIAEYDQMLMWAAPTGPNLERRGVVLVSPDADGAFSFRYEGGSVIDLDVLGYFTNEAAELAQTGLYVPSASAEIIQGEFLTGSSVVGTMPDYAGAAFVTLSAESGAPRSGDPRDLVIASGRTIATALTVAPSPDGDGQGVVISSTADLQAQLQLLGVFLAES